MIIKEKLRPSLYMYFKHTPMVAVYPCDLIFKNPAKAGRILQSITTKIRTLTEKQTRCQRYKKNECRSSEIKIIAHHGCLMRCAII